MTVTTSLARNFRPLRGRKFRPPEKIRGGAKIPAQKSGPATQNSAPYTETLTLVDLAKFRGAGVLEKSGHRFFVRGAEIPALTKKSGLEFSGNLQ